MIDSIAIVGAGAVGGYYGARLAQHGRAVHFLLRSDYAAVKQHGLAIKSCDGDFFLPPDRLNVYDRASEMPVVDLVVVTLKTTSNHQFAELIGPLLGPHTCILTLQNGLGNEQSLADLFGGQRILGGLAFTCINRIGPGQIHHMDHGTIRLGEFSGGPTPRANEIADIFRSSQIPCDVLDDLQFGRWEKLVWNVPFNGLGAAMDLTADRLIATPAGRAVVGRLMAEVIAAANGLGIRLPQTLIETKIRQTASMGPYQTSMQIDRKMGRPMEIDAIITKPLQTARAAGVATPLLGMVNELLTVLATP